MSVLSLEDGGRRVCLDSPLAMPAASAYLYNRCMLLQVSPRGFVQARYLDPEPRTYSYPPNLEAQTFFQPEQPWFSHSPGRFVYLRDEDSGALWSLPYEPVRRLPRRFRFIAEPEQVRWELEQDGLALTLAVSLPPEAPLECWQLVIENRGDRPQRLSVYPVFSVGYMSWMYQGARYERALQALVARCVTPWQQLADYPRIRRLRDLTFLAAGSAPLAWEARRMAFEGEGGLQQPAGLASERLGGGEAHFETPVAALQYRLALAPGERWQQRLLFGAARDAAEIRACRRRFLEPAQAAAPPAAVAQGPAAGGGGLWQETPDAPLDGFVNHWLARQVHYHGTLHRLSTDPQTRNYLQDAMGLCYLDPAAARAALLRVLSQQAPTGALPDGILLHEQATLKYINQVPHSDQALWLPLALLAYLDESGDEALLQQRVTDRAGATLPVWKRVDAALDSLLAARDARGLCLIGQGDWCDPMNMVGPAGRGVSGWLSLAAVAVLRDWSAACARRHSPRRAARFAAQAAALAAACREHLWDGQWFARGISDNGRAFGVAGDREGRIYLNPQSWALLAGCVDRAEGQQLIAAVETHLATPYGFALLAPAYTGMQEHIGRLTQKYPGVAENGSVYNHAAAFYARALYAWGEPDRAFAVLRQMLPGPAEEDLLRRGQLPVAIPNYYRGAWQQLPEQAGRSSQLIHTGSAAWCYRLLVEQLFGLAGEGDGLRVRPALPAHWPQARVRRRFRGAELEVHYRRRAGSERQRLWLDGEAIAGDRIDNLQAGRCYDLQVEVPG